MRLNDHGNTDLDYKRSGALRNDASRFERKLWVALREQAKNHGLKFRRQQAIRPFIVDFACMEARLIVELDGQSHDTRLAYDKAREQDLVSRGFHVLRFTNNDVGANAEGVAVMIVKQAELLIEKGEGCAQRMAPHPNPPHKGEGIPAVLVEREY